MHDNQSFHVDRILRVVIATTVERDIRVAQYMYIPYTMHIALSWCGYEISSNLINAIY